MCAGTPTPRTAAHTFQVAPARRSSRRTKCGSGAHTVPTCQRVCTRASPSARVNSMKGGHAQTRLPGPCMDTGMDESTTGMLPVPVLPPSSLCTAVAHFHPCPHGGQRHMGSAGVFATAGGMHLHRAPLRCLGRPAKTHVPSPGDTRVPCSMAQATAAPQSLLPLGLFPAAQEASLFPFPLSAPCTGLSDTTHVQGLAAPPVTHWVPQAASTAQGVSTHVCAQTRTHVHTRGGRCTPTAHA